MKQIAHFGYAILLENRTKPQIAELEVLLSEPEKKEEMIDRQNAEAMAGLGGFGLVPPPARLKKKGPTPPSQPKKGDG